MMKNNHKKEKDIILICKGRYNNKYKSELEAFRAYYHKHYSGMEDFEPERGFIVNLFLKPTIQYILETRKYDKNIIYSFINNGLFDYSFREKYFFKDGFSDFYDVLYYRMLKWICLLDMKRKINDEDWEYIDIDFSEYPLDDENWEGVI